MVLMICRSLRPGRPVAVDSAGRRT